MTGYIIRRLFQALIVVIGVIFITFILIKFIPGGQCAAALGTRATKANCKIYNHDNGLDQNVFVQFYYYMKHLIHGDMGYSYVTGENIFNQITGAMARSAMLVFMSIFLSFAIGIPIGVWQAMKRNSWIDHSLTALMFFLYSVPIFVSGTLALYWLADKWNWFPSYVDPNAGVFSPFVAPWQFVLPIALLTLAGLAGVTRYVRSSLLDNLVQDYVRTARAKGASHTRVVFRHALRNALLPMITFVGLSIPALFGGALIIETLFGFQGMGYLTVQSTLKNDYLVVVGATLFAGLATAIGSLLADILYATADPRIRLGA